MEWDKYKDYMNSFIGALLLLISLIVIPEIRARKKYWIPIVILIGFLTWLGIDKTNRDNLKEQKFNTTDSLKDKKNDSLSQNVITLESTISSNHKNDLEFQKRLDSMFHIIRDSSNRPKQTITNNYSTPALKYYYKNFKAIKGQTTFLTPGSPLNIDQYRVTRNGMELPPTETYIVKEGKVIVKIPIDAGDDISIHWTK